MVSTIDGLLQDLREPMVADRLGATVGQIEEVLSNGYSPEMVEAFSESVSELVEVAKEKTPSALLFRKVSSDVNLIADNTFERAEMTQVYFEVCAEKDYSIAKKEHQLKEH